MRSAMLGAVEGFLLNLGLLLAVGAQASFVLRQGLARRHVPAVVATCCLCDAALIGLGTAAAGSATVEGEAGRALAVVGAAFMLAYGARAFRAAARPSPAPGTAGPGGGEVPGGGPAAAVLATLAVTLLNPHVYLDAFVLLGAAAAQHAPGDRPWFALGAVAASVAWFVALGRGAALLAGPLGRPGVRAALDLLVGAVMWWAAVGLLAWALATPPG